MTSSPRRVGDLAEQIRGVTFKKQEASAVAADGLIPVIRAGNITERGLVFDDLVYVPASKVSSKQMLRCGDVVIAASSGSIDIVGKSAPVTNGFAGAFGAFLKVLRPNDEVDPRYFAHYFKTPAYRTLISSKAAGVNINNIRNEDLDELEIPLPPLAEQRRIAGILDAADALRAKRREALAQLDTLLQSTFLDMFGDPVTNPKGWERKPLDELGMVQTGSTPPSKLDGMFDGPIPFITPSDLRDTWVQPSRTVTEAGAQKSRIVERGATLVCCIGATIGKMGKASTRSAFNQQINAVSWNDRVSPAYGLEALRFLKTEIAADGASTTLPILKKSLFQKLEIPLPPISLQKRFSAAVDSAERLRISHRTHLADLDTLFDSLQQRAFSGAL